MINKPCLECGGLHIGRCGTGVDPMDAATLAANEREDWTCLMCGVPRAPFYGSWCKACVWRAKNPRPPVLRSCCKTPIEKDHEKDCHLNPWGPMYKIYVAETGEYHYPNRPDCICKWCFTQREREAGRS